MLCLLKMKTRTKYCKRGSNDLNFRFVFPNRQLLLHQDAASEKRCTATFSTSSPVYQPGRGEVEHGEGRAGRTGHLVDLAYVLIVLLFFFAFEGYCTRSCLELCFSCFDIHAVKASLPVPPATSMSLVPGWGANLSMNWSFQRRWIPALITSFIKSYFSATFSNTSFTEMHDTLMSRGQLTQICPGG